MTELTTMLAQTSTVDPLSLILGYGPLGVFVVLLVTGKFVSLTREVEREREVAAVERAEKERHQAEAASLRQAMDERIVPALYEQVVPALRESTQALQRLDRVMVRMLDKGIANPDDVVTGGTSPRGGD